MKKLLTPIVCLLTLVSCEKTILREIPKVYSLSIDSVLTRDGYKSLAKDVNGLYHLKITTIGTPQSHRITGRILEDGKEPSYPQKIDWENNMYWWLRKGDTSALITQAYINYYTGQFTIINLPPMIARKDELVRTINLASYSGTNGEVNTVIAPIREMIGDTMIVQAKHTLSNKIIYTKIVLE
jgi:hypothetical protein